MSNAIKAAFFVAGLGVLMIKNGVSTFQLSQCTIGRPGTVVVSITAYLVALLILSNILRQNQS